MGISNMTELHSGAEAVKIIDGRVVPGDRKIK